MKPSRAMWTAFAAPLWLLACSREPLHVVGPDLGSDSALGADLSPAFTRDLSPALTPDQAPLASKRVFITRKDFDGNLGGLAGADKRCDEAAASVGLGGAWAAYLATSANQPSDRLVNARYLAVGSGTPIFASRAQTMAAPTSALVTDENGQLIPNAPSVWTGVGTAAFAAHCDNWSKATNAHQGTYGDLNTVRADWMAAVVAWCSFRQHLLCFER